ncbi:MAG: Crp/Fnr family transcriptional regulator [Saprospiraceae bacterium]|nr:Crp/Fnr family transcriptional regulator [Saprospiraceae bacterium]
MNPINVLIAKLDQSSLWQKEVILKRNEYLVVQGDVNSDLFHILEGTLRIFIMDDDEEHIVRFGYENDLVIALDCFLTSNPTSFYIQAIKKTRLKKLSRSIFEEFIHSSSELSSIWTSLLQSFVHQQIEREFDLLTSSPITRYKRVLLRSPRLFQEIPHKYIASYLRMAPETLSRIKKKMT